MLAQPIIDVQASQVIRLLAFRYLPDFAIFFTRDASSWKHDPVGNRSAVSLGGCLDLGEQLFAPSGYRTHPATRTREVRDLAMERALLW